MSDACIGYYNKQDLIRLKLLNIRDWKIRTKSQKRHEYDKSLRTNLKNVPKSVSEDNILPLGNEESLDHFVKPKPNKTRQTRQTMTRFSRVFSKNMVKKGSNQTGERKENLKDEKLQMQELMFDKVYFNRMLWDEHVRMLYLRSHNLNIKLLKKKPYLRLWMEVLTHRISENSRQIRTLIRKELGFLKNRYHVQRQLHFWQTLNSLTLDQLYDKKRQQAFRIRIRNDTFTEQLDETWKLFHRGLFDKVKRNALGYINKIETWPDQSPTSVKFKLLADLYYLRGMALMQLDKYDQAFKCFRKDGEIGEFADISVSKARTKDNIARIQAIKGNYKSAIKIWSERIEEMKEPIEKAWVFYNIALCYAMEENYDKAIEVVNKSIQHAEKIKSYCWELNGYLLLANCSAQLGTLREASVRSSTLVSLRAINKAYQCAVFLANVSVIHKVMNIAVNIYNAFKDIDLTMLEEVWSPNLMDYTRKVSNLDHDKENEISNLNMNNIGNNNFITTTLVSPTTPLTPTIPSILKYDCTMKTAKKLKSHKAQLKKFPKIKNSKADAVSTVQPKVIEVVESENDTKIVKKLNELPKQLSTRSTPITAVEVVTTLNDEVTDLIQTPLYFPPINSDFQMDSDSQVMVCCDDNTIVDVTNGDDDDGDWITESEYEESI